MYSYYIAERCLSISPEDKICTKEGDKNQWFLRRPRRGGRRRRRGWQKGGTPNRGFLPLATSSSPLFLPESDGARRAPISQRECFEKHHLIHQPYGWSPALIQTARGAGIRSEGYGLPASGEGYGRVQKLKSLPLWGRGTTAKPWWMRCPRKTAAAFAVHLVHKRAMTARWHPNGHLVF